MILSWLIVTFLSNASSIITTLLFAFVISCSISVADTPSETSWVSRIPQRPNPITDSRVPMMVII